jgi:hypothetical protein
MPNIPPWALWIVVGLVGITAVVGALKDVVKPVGDLVFAIKSQVIRLCGEPPTVLVRASTFENGQHVALAGPLAGGDGRRFGEDVLINFPPESPPPDANIAEWNIGAPQAGLTFSKWSTPH